MLDQFLSDAFFPFTLSLALLFGLLVLELILLFIGASLFADGTDAPEIDAPEVDLGVELDGFDVDGLDIDGLDVDGAELDLGDAGDIDVADGADIPSPGVGLGILSWLGFGRMPAAIWLASLFLAFGLAGITVQLVSTSLIGAPLPAILAALPAIAAALWFARSFGALFARLLPKTETEALSERRLARRKGVVSQGTAARGRPAEVRITDQFGNMHYIRAEPLRDEETIAQGSEVLVVRLRQDDAYRLVSLS